MSDQDINGMEGEKKMEFKGNYENGQLENEYYLNEFTLEKHNFHHDYDNCKCPDCEGLGYFFSSPADLGGLGSYLFPKKECARCKGKGYLDRD
jgi:hypothetical protein